MSCDTMNIIEQITERAKSFFANAKGSHDWEHTERVYNLCVQIGEKERADMEVVKVAALLHDIARPIQDESLGKICHAEKGAEMARQLLAEYDISPEKSENIIHCIRAHRFRGTNIPETLEAKILFDADKLDSIGAVGIGRAFLFAGEINARLHNKKLHDKDIDIMNTAEYSKDDTAYREYLVKLIKIKDKIQTAEGKRLAEQRHNFMAEFFERMNAEVDGLL